MRAMWKSVSAAARRVRSGRRRSRGGAGRCGWNLFFLGAETRVPITIVRDSPTLMVAAVEDLCWCLGVQDWVGREPSRSDEAAHAAWRAEVSRLEDKRVRVRTMVHEALTSS